MIIPTNPALGQYGGLELICGMQAKYFEEKGHEVHLFASEGSYQPKPPGHLYTVGKPATVNPAEAFKAYWANEKSRKALTEADIVCDHSWGYYTYAVHDKLKHVCKVHHGPDPGFAAKPPVDKPNLIAVSHNHAKQLTKMSGVTWRGVENGIDLSLYPFKKEKGDYFLWISRIYAFKGTHRFIDLCNKAKVKGIVAGGSFGDVKDYVDQIKDMIVKSEYVTSEGQIGTDSVSADGQIGVGVSHKKKVELYQNAKAVILPIIEELPIQGPSGRMARFIEPFGLITPEANACGTPVIVVPSGGWHETMTHGYNGFFANSNEEFIYYMKRVGEIKPEDCRAASERFSYKRMGEEYLKLFDAILSGDEW